MELWDVYDKDRIKKGKTIERGKEFFDDDFHLVVHVCIFNQVGEMLIQQRQPFKEGWPNRWDLTAGGSATTGDSSQTAAEREVEEELGIKLNLQSSRPHLTMNFKNGFDDIYLVEKEINLSDIQLQEEEVQDVRWVSNQEIQRMVKNGEFVPYYPSLIDLLFEMRKRNDLRFM